MLTHNKILLQSRGVILIVRECAFFNLVGGVGCDSFSLGMRFLKSDVVGCSSCSLGCVSI